MNIYEQKVSDLSAEIQNKITIVADTDELNKQLAVEFADLLEEKQKTDELLTIICPVGPIDYKFFADEVNRRGLSCRNLRTINMDEYLDDNDEFISPNHPLSFKKFMEDGFFSNLPDDKRPLPENIIFPEPACPEKITELIDEIGGADICWAGFGISGHIAFNDPPAFLGEPEDLESLKNCKTRKITTPPMSMAQMLMGATNGNYEILPTRAVTIGMYELLKSKHFHFTFLRNWHQGLWRRALLGEVTHEFPGSLMQLHPNYKITMTELASEVPLINTAQEVGEK